MVLECFIWLLMVLSGVRCFWPVLEGSGRFLRDMCIDLSSSALMKMVLDGYG